MFLFIINPNNYFYVAVVIWMVAFALVYIYARDNEHYVDIQSAMLVGSIGWPIAIVSLGILGGAVTIIKVITVIPDGITYVLDMILRKIKGKLEDN
jgi:hypothetical protein